MIRSVGMRPVCCYDPCFARQAVDPDKSQASLARLEL
jgi:hypothetical protein